MCSICRYNQFLDGRAWSERGTYLQGVLKHELYGIIPATYIHAWDFGNEEKHLEGEGERDTLGLPAREGVMGLGNA